MGRNEKGLSEGNQFRKYILTICEGVENMIFVTVGTHEQPFDRLVKAVDDLKRDGVVLVDFYADWCGPCKMVSPILEEISEERNDFKIIKVNVDKASELATKYGVMSIPTMIVFKNGVEVDKNIGFLPKDDIIKLIEKNM